MSTLVAFRDITRENPVLGGTGRTLKANCRRHGIDVVSVNKRVLALTRQNYDLLLEKIKETT
jgi:hypothetical protein